MPIVSSSLFLIQWSICKIPYSRRVAVFALLWIGLCGNYAANAQTFSLPATSSDGYYTITWSGANTYGVIDELRADGTHLSSPAGGTPSGAVTITRPSGTYYYRLRTCVVGQGSPVCTNSATKSITVTIPVPTVTAYFTPDFVAPGGSTVLSWKSTNAAYCRSSDISGVNAASGTLTYTVPADYAQSAFLAVITCFRAGPGNPGSAAAKLNILGTAIISYSYDELGRIKEVNNAGNDIVNYEYDAADNRTKKTVTKH
jgi:YD repeat-containing protein